MKSQPRIRVGKHQRVGVIVTTSEEDVPRDQMFALSQFDYRGAIHSESPGDYVEWLIKRCGTVIRPNEISGFDILDGTLWRNRAIPDEYEHHWSAPIFDDETEVKGVGVTYKGSRDYRERSKSGGDTSTNVAWNQPFKLEGGQTLGYSVVRMYDYAYQGPRPEIFDKAVGIQRMRIAGPGQFLGLRTDSNVMVNEGEIGLIIDSFGRIVGWFIGNDFTDSELEAECALYLPEAKCFTRCVGLSPWIVLFHEPSELDDPRKPLSLKTRLSLTTYDRNDGSKYEDGSYLLEEMQRDPHELAWWAGLNHEYPAGLMALCGTGLAKGKSIKEQHIVHIHSEGIGTLINPTRRLTDRRPRPSTVTTRSFKLA